MALCERDGRCVCVEGRPMLVEEFGESIFFEQRLQSSDLILPCRHRLFIFSLLIITPKLAETLLMVLLLARRARPGGAPPLLKVLGHPCLCLTFSMSRCACMPERLSNLNSFSRPCSTVATQAGPHNQAADALLDHARFVVRHHRTCCDTI